MHAIYNENYNRLINENIFVVGIKVCKVVFKHGMFSNCNLVSYDDYVPRLCSHHPSLFPIECLVKHTVMLCI